LLFLVAAPCIHVGFEKFVELVVVFPCHVGVEVSISVSVEVSISVSVLGTCLISNSHVKGLKIATQLAPGVTT